MPLGARFLNMAPEVSVVVPALNEEKTVGAVIERILAVLENERIAGEVILIDGCSSDRTGAQGRRVARAVTSRSKAAAFPVVM